MKQYNDFHTGGEPYYFSLDGLEEKVQEVFGEKVSIREAAIRYLTWTLQKRIRDGGPKSFTIQEGESQKAFLARVKRTMDVKGVPAWVIKGTPPDKS